RWPVENDRADCTLLDWRQSSAPGHVRIPGPLAESPTCPSPPSFHGATTGQYSFVFPHCRCCTSSESLELDQPCLPSRRFVTHYSLAPTQVVRLKTGAPNTSA